MSIHLITGKKGEPHVTSQNQGIINSMLFGVGKYVFDFGSNFETYVYNNTVTIKDGQGLINGRHFEIEENTTESVVIDNGEVGSSRYDLIVARYTKDNQGFEDVSLEVLKGESVRLPSVPTEPTFSNASILDGAILTEFPLFRVEVVGVSELTVTPKFEPITIDLAGSLEEINELSEEVQELIDTQEERINSKIDRIDAPKIYYGTTEPTNLVADYPDLMLGDLYFQYELGSGNRDGFGEIKKIWMAGISSLNEDVAVWKEITTSLSAKWSNYYTKTETNNLLTDKLDRDDGIKLFYGTTDPSQNVLDGSKTGDIYIRLNGGNNRNMSQVIGMWIVSVYPSSGNYYWQKIPLGDYYNKTETDNLLNAKQGTLTAGTNITIDANNVISATGGGGGTVDTAMSDSSTNAVQNRVIKSYIDTGLGTKQNTTTISTNTTDTDITLTVADNTEYRYTQELDSIDLTMPNGNFIASIVFESGSTATVMTYDSGIKWSGDDVVMGFFVPTADKTYNIVLWYDGININGIARGV